MTSIAANLQAVRARVAAACNEAGRPAESVQLLAASKSWPAATLRQAVAAGQTCFGENYAKEAVHKAAELADLDLEWHFIGPLQSNKTNLVAENFSWVHSVDRLRIAERLAAQRPPAMPPLQLCIQVNLSAEDSKSGCAVDATPALARAVAELPRLRLRGLMAIPEPSEDYAFQRSRFALLRELLEQLNRDDLGLDMLSMGMSHDLEAAIMEGATLVRVGTAIFGERQKT